MLTFMSLAVAGLLTASALPAVAASQGNACDLLPFNDLQGVLGSGFTPRQDIPLAGPTPTMSNCAYGKSGSRGTDDGVAISLQQIAYDSAQYLKMEQAGIKQQGGGVT